MWWRIFIVFLISIAAANAGRFGGQKPPSPSPHPIDGNNLSEGVRLNSSTGHYEKIPTVTLKKGQELHWQGETCHPHVKFDKSVSEISSLPRQVELRQDLSGEVPIYFFHPGEENHAAVWGQPQSMAEASIHAKIKAELDAFPQAVVGLQGTSVELRAFFKTVAEPAISREIVHRYAEERKITEERTARWLSEFPDTAKSVAAGAVRTEGTQVKMPCIVVLHNVGSLTSPEFKLADGTCTMEEIMSLVPPSLDVIVVSCKSPHIFQTVGNVLRPEQLVKILKIAISNARREGLAKADFKRLLREAAEATLTSKELKILLAFLLAMPAEMTLTFALEEEGEAGEDLPAEDAEKNVRIQVQTHAFTIVRPKVLKDWIVSGIAGFTGLCALLTWWFGVGDRVKARTPAAVVTLLLLAAATWFFAMEMRLLRVEGGWNMFVAIAVFLGTFLYSGFAAWIGGVTLTFFFGKISPLSEQDKTSLLLILAGIILVPSHWIAFNFAVYADALLVTIAKWIGFAALAVLGFIVCVLLSDLGTKQPPPSE